MVRKTVEQLGVRLCAIQLINTWVVFCVLLVDEYRHERKFYSSTYGRFPRVCVSCSSSKLAILFYSNTEQHRWDGIILCHKKESRTIPLPRKSRKSFPHEETYAGLYPVERMNYQYDTLFVC
jgi:hypothetical protein